MQEIELNDDDWLALKRKLIYGSVEEAMRDYTPPVRVKHGCEYMTYEKGNEDDSHSDN